MSFGRVAKTLPKILIVVLKLLSNDSTCFGAILNLFLGAIRFNLGRKSRFSQFPPPLPKDQPLRFPSQPNPYLSQKQTAPIKKPDAKVRFVSRDICLYFSRC